jgi:phosphohistidine phosphatase
MKTLYIMRHGKAEDGFEKADYKRKLTSKGIRRSREAGEKLKEMGVRFDAIVCSSANRTVETAEIMAKAIDFPSSEIQQKKELYLASVTVILECIHSFEDRFSNILVVGHNPGIPELLTSLSGELIDWAPTSFVVAIDFQTNSWKNVGKVSAKISATLIPRA